MEKGGKRRGKKQPAAPEPHEEEAPTVDAPEQDLEPTDAVAAALAEGDVHTFALYCPTLLELCSQHAPPPQQQKHTSSNPDEGEEEEDAEQPSPAAPAAEGGDEDEDEVDDDEDEGAGPKKGGKKGGHGKRERKEAGPLIPAHLQPGYLLELVSGPLAHRITHVLRCRSQTPLILFSNEIAISCALHERTFAHVDAGGASGLVAATIRQVTLNLPHAPTMHLLQGLLKKETFETVAYYAAQMGISTVQPLVTAKTQREWGGKAERTRLGKIMVAACEQSKNFVLPKLRKPVPFDQILAKLPKPPRRPRAAAAAAGGEGALPAGPRHNVVVNLFFEADGRPLLDTVQQLRAAQVTHINLVFGPEGGLTMAEKAALAGRGFVCVALTPTILRAQEAVAVGIGALRSLMNDTLSVASPASPAAPAACAAAAPAAPQEAADDQ
ncbi:putative Ribosomal RNA small subunit methyltransferase E [Paratrimastix pyriformis]|uniref:16S rRNA (uracil(1498)-N(3))-methyltransferase n=1 Tax=Paratrimastix pyriformis TaxID=342808 RepID=A0ABQ8UVY9_9EUKA|nr:putative Ribosomal RNA small subunit methyltransferase E [Paratrimastix pyriformis]